jgi:hypothetical protein
MNTDEQNKDTFRRPAGYVALLWCVIVLLSYYVSNADYYREKISTFGHYFLRIIG